MLMLRNRRRLKEIQCLMLALVMGWVFQACEEEKVTVTLKTFHVEQVTATSGSIRCTVVNEGGTLQEAGLCFSATSNLPTVTSSRFIPSVGSLTDFTTSLTGLSVDSTYRFRAYARVNDSVYYGTVYAFKPTTPLVDLVAIEGGTFNMGATPEQATSAATNEFPVHAVTLSNYRIGKYEVTTSQFAQFLNSRMINSTASGPGFDGSVYKYMVVTTRNLYYDQDKSLWLPVSGLENHPVTNVTWYGANEYCRWAGGHLPTEAQWEYAARGGRSAAGTLYSGGSVAADVAWYYATTKDQPGVVYFAQPVGGKQPNELGLYDMSGNVWEWCADWYTAYTDLAKRDPMGINDVEAAEAGVTQKVRRGGGWADTQAGTLRVSHRAANTKASQAGSVGFRLAANE
ncbi:MAG TPA: hypothetical protein DD409_05760 [Bacteroidales bacterium]|nr:hypothetical protein [Bacteroidales bacterium]